VKRTITQLAIVALLATQSPAVAQTTADSTGAEATITLQQALRLALEKNPTAERQRIEVDFTRNQSRLIRTSILPSVDLYGSTTWNAEEVSFGEGEDAFTIVPKNDWNYRLALVQPLYAGGRELKAYRQSKLAVDSSVQDLRATEEQLLLRTASDYLGVVQGEALVAVEQSNVALSERRRTQAVDFFEAGEVTRLDVLRADTAVKGAQRRLVGATQMRESAESRLRIDLAMDASIDVETVRISFPPLPDEATLVRQAEASRPETQRADIMRQISTLEVAKQRGRYLPTVFAEASTSAQKVTFPTDTNTALTLNFSVPIFQSGEIESYVASARDRQRQAELVLDEVRRGVREDVQLSLVDLRTAETNLSLAREQLAAAQQEYEQTFELYQAQEATSLDVDVAETNLAEARRAVATGEIDRDLAELRVWFASGAIKNVLMNEETK
jgi:outer membrane protein